MTELEEQEVKEESRKLVADQLMFWMNHYNMDRFQLAERSGLSADAIYKIGRGNRGASVDSLAVLAAGLGISLQMFWMQVK